VSLLSASELSAESSTGAAVPPAVLVDDVHLTYRTSFEKKPTLRGALLRMGRRERSVREIEALKGVSFDVAHGSVLGIVGANGAGKSTLVRTIAGILPPTAGRIEIRGRVSTLLALGVGFNANLSGSDNVYLGGLAAGLSREEIADRYAQIADFAELDDFMDLPMRTYSSGMYSRLAFSVAVHMDPDILLVDEALATGDARFKHKSFEKMRELCAQARTIFLVSHALGSVKDLCTEAIWLHKGALVQRGTPAEVVSGYTRFLKVGEDAITLEDV
jgi:teichoic acid transport system ATP-binding protein